MDGGLGRRDEPTSGLDARAAAIVMRAVRNTVDTGRTVARPPLPPSLFPTCALPGLAAPDFGADRSLVATAASRVSMVRR